MNVIYTAGLSGLGAKRFEVSCTRSRGHSGADEVRGLSIAGLPDVAGRDVAVRVRSALKSVGVSLRNGEYTFEVVLRPIDAPKHPSAYDLAVAVIVLIELGVIPPRPPGVPLFLGELSLAGDLRPVRGLLALLNPLGLEKPFAAFVPKGQSDEASLASGIVAFPAQNLAEVVAHLTGKQPLEKARPAALDARLPSLSDPPSGPGLEAIKTAAASRRSLLLVGPPGSGAMMLARRLPGFLPPLTLEEAQTVTLIFSVAGLPIGGLAAQRPLRAPHHTVSEQGLLGGGEVLRPGEVTLAHHGVLFLDEVTEFRRPILDSLRVVLKEGKRHVVRGGEGIFFPAQPLLVGSTYACPCGYRFGAINHCRCTNQQIDAYLKRVPWDLFHLVAPMIDSKEAWDLCTTQRSLHAVD